MRDRPPALVLPIVILSLLANAAAEARDPPSRRSRAFDGQPTVLSERGILEGVSMNGSPLPWPTVGNWRLRPLQTSPELDPVPDSAPARPLEPRRAEPTSPLPTVDIPLPPRRPTSLQGIAPLDIDSRGFAAGGNCFAQLTAAGVRFTPASQPGGNPACAIDNPVQVSSIAERSAPGGAISLPDRPTISCRMAVRFSEWLRSVAPALGSSRNAALSSITTGPGWDCRPRNRQAGARLSAHGNGDALDINTFFFANRARLPVQGHGRDPAFHAARMAACSYFSTVLGPGAAFHDSHLHLDIMKHGRDASYRLCR